MYTVELHTPKGTWIYQQAWNATIDQWKIQGPMSERAFAELFAEKVGHFAKLADTMTFPKGYATCRE